MPFKEFWFCFVPLFFAVDAPGIMPMFLSLTEGMDTARLGKIVWQSTLTAAMVGLLFLLAGNALFRYLGITTQDFMIAGGTLLFIISISDILGSRKRQRHADPESIGAVPIGVPLIAGPAVLTTSLILESQYGFLMTALALSVNIIIAGVVFRFSRWILKLLGKNGSAVLSKIAGLILASLGIMLIRKGIQEIFFP